jgi:hypothetical protein
MSEYWDDCATSIYSIASVLYKLYKDKLRYIGSNKWEYYDDIENKWILIKDKDKLKQYFIYDAKADLLHRIAQKDLTSTTFFDLQYMYKVGLLINDKNIRKITKEAKDFFVIDF